MRLEEIGKDWARSAEEIRFVRRVEAAARNNSGARITPEVCEGE